MNYPSHIQCLVDYPKEVLTAAQIAPIVGKDPNTLRYMAKHMPERLPFPCIASEHDRTVKFPKWPFLEAFGYQNTNQAERSQREPNSRRLNARPKRTSP